MDIPSFITRIVNGPGGFKVQEDREFIVYPDREVGLAGFVVRCLANPQCEGSQEVLDAILARRAKVSVVVAPAPEAHLRPVEELVRVKAEAYEHRIYELEYAYMMSQPDTEESKSLWASCQQVKANYMRDYPDRPLNPKPRPLEVPASHTPFAPAGAIKKPRKPYTRREKPAATPTKEGGRSE